MRPTSRVLWRHSRVSPQWLVVAVPFRARGEGVCAGQEHRRPGSAYCAFGVGVSPEGEGFRRLESTDGRARPAARVSESIVAGVSRRSGPSRSSEPDVSSPESEETSDRLGGELRSDGAEASGLRLLVSPGRYRSHAQGSRALQGRSGDRFRRSGRVGQKDDLKVASRGVPAEAVVQRKTHSGSNDDASHGARFLSAS